MSRLTFVGLGLHSELGMSLEGLEEAKKADHVFAEFYTSYMPGLNIVNLQNLIGKKVEILSREAVEEEAETSIISCAKRSPCVFLAPGDPNVATTHVALRLRAEKSGIKTAVVHAASISSAISGATGLQNYKFGRTVTVPFKSVSTSETPYENICENKQRGLHTLTLLDIDSENEKYMTIPEGLRLLLEMEERKSNDCVALSTVAIGLARLGSRQGITRADSVEDLLRFDWGGPPHCIVFPGRLHFMEVEALETLCGAKREILEGLI